MCGIAGFISKSKQPELIIKLTEMISHRGPDQMDTIILDFGNSYLHLGSSRLAITGLSDGDMPMIDENKNALVYNGEIYELEKINQNNLDTKSDTRVLFNFLKNNQLERITNLNGMFAFAYFDKSENKLTLARDKLGIKPLYYTKSNDFKIIFSSELKPLLEIRKEEQFTTESKINEYIFLGKNASNNTLFQNIKTVEPGEYITYKNDEIIQNKYFQIDSLKDGEDYENNFEEIFKTALDDQLDAEIPIDILLSGGIDSSLIAYTAKTYLNREVNAYSLSYEDKKYDEKIKASSIAKELGINLKTFKFNNSMNESTIEELLLKLPEPVLDPSIVGTYYLSKEVSKYSKSVISGDGADELFGGYSWYRAVLVSKQLGIFIPSKTKTIGNILKKISTDYIGLEEKLRILSNIKYLDPENKVLFIQNYLTGNRDEVRELSNLHDSYLNDLDLKNVHYLDRCRELDIKSYLYTNILKKGDTASMLNGLELRPVYLDERILKYALNKPNSLNINLFNSKIELRKKLKKLNNKIANAPKHGFPHDFGGWTESVGISYLESEWKDFPLVSKFLNYKNTNQIENYHLSRSIWKLYSLLKWIDINKVSIR